MFQYCSHSWVCIWFVCCFLYFTGKISAGIVLICGGLLDGKGMKEGMATSGSLPLNPDVNHCQPVS